MKNVLDLFDEVCSVLQVAGIDPQELLDSDPDAKDLARSIPLFGAEQPSWPLAKTVRGFAMLPSNIDDLSDDDEDEASENLECWIVFNGNHPHDRSPYAPRDCWNN
jgi:hypothetical protein